MQIHYLAARDDIQGVQRQIAVGVSVDSKYPTSGKTPLMFAAEDYRASPGMLNFLIMHGANPNIISTEGYTPLGLAAKSGSLAKTRYLLLAGADAQLESASGYSPLIHAVYASEENVDIVEALLEAEADPKLHPRQYPSENPARIAYRLRHFNVLKVLLDAGISLSDIGWTELMYAIAYGSVEDVEKRLNSASIELQYAIDNGKSMWHFCLLIGDLAKVQFLYQKGIKREIDELRAAVRRDNPDLVTWLIETGANIEARAMPWGDTALIKAASYGSVKSLGMLIEAGANIHAQSELGRTALEYAQNAKTVKILAEAGANVNHIDEAGYSRLKNAVEDGEIEVVKSLLELGADPNLSRTGETPLHIAVRYDQIEIARLLLDAGANPNYKYDEWFPLSYTKTTEAAQLLLDFGATINAKNSFGSTALDHLEDQEIIDFLKSQGR